MFTLMGDEGMWSEDSHGVGSVKGFKEITLFRGKEVKGFEE